MSTLQVGVAELDQAIDALAAITRVRADGEGAFFASEERVQATAYPWIVAGSALKQFCRLRGIGQGGSPFPGAIGMRDRLCYGSRRDLSPQILWDTCTNDTDELITVLRDLRGALASRDRRPDRRADAS